MISSCWKACLVASLFAGHTTASRDGTQRPVVGILSVPLKAGGDCVTYFGAEAVQAPDAAATSCFDNIYVKWIESAGGRVVPIRYDSSVDELDKLFDNLNGVLFTGGDTVITDLESQYMQSAGHLLNRSIAASAKGDHVPVWGTCMGIQTLSILVANDPSVLQSGAYKGVDPLMMRLNLTTAGQSSRMYTALPKEVQQWVVSEPVTTNLHHDGVTPDTFSSNEKLDNFFRVISTNMDVNDLPFVSTIEGKVAPVYGVQWHPERPQFEWSKVDESGNDPINHSIHAVLSMQSFANFFVSEVRMNESFALVNTSTVVLST